MSLFIRCSSQPDCVPFLYTIGIEGTAIVLGTLFIAALLFKEWLDTR